MSLNILWTDTAKETFNYILKYLDENWGKKYVHRFINKTESTLKILSNSPFIFKTVLENPKVRKGIIHKNSSFLYRIIDDRIELLVFWDTRQEPFM